MKDCGQEPMLGGNVDVESMRDEYESNSEWRLRRKFLEMNHDSLTHARLVCLSKCFVNMAVYGCSYPWTVKEEINDRSRGILDKVESDKKSLAKQKYAASFVKAAAGSGTLSCTSSESVVRFKESSSSGQGPSKLNIFEGQAKAATWQKEEHVQDEDSHPEQAKFAVLPNINSENTKAAQGNTANSYQTSTAAALPGTSSSVHNSRQTQNSAQAGAGNTKTALSKQECLLAFQREKDPLLQKIRKLAYEVLNLKVASQNAKELLSSAGNRVPIHIDYNMTHHVTGATNSFLCQVSMEGVAVASGKGTNMKNAKTDACESALKVIQTPQIKIVCSEGKRTLQVLGEASLSQCDNSCQLPVTQCDTDFGYSSSNSTVSAVPFIGISKRKINNLKFLESFIVVEKMDAPPSGEEARVLRESADFNRANLEFDFVNHGVATRCKVLIENQVISDAMGTTRNMARDAAAAQCLSLLKTMCWVLKIKQHVDSNTSISKDEIESQIKMRSDQIGRDNIGSKLLQKMGWSGGGVGKDGSGIAEPVSLVGVMNREGLGLGMANGITENFRKRMKEVIQQYATSDEQGDMKFSNEFSIEERKIIHEECRKLNLRSTSRGKGEERYLCVSRKMSANQLFQRVISCGGETPKYKLLPPGSDFSPDQY